MVPYTYQGSHDTYLRYAASTPKLDPAVLVPYLAQATKHLGLVPTLSVTEYPPFLLARLVNSLDHVTEGRIGWNCVTGSNDGAAQNYGHDGQPPHDERYDVADEFADVVTRLWEAWEPDAVVLDPRCADVRRRQQGPSDQSRGQVFQVPRAAERAALAAGTPADLPGRRLAARAGIRLALGRHDHHRCRQRRGDEGVSRGGAQARRGRSAAIPTHQGAVPGLSDRRHDDGGGAASGAGCMQEDANASGHAALRHVAADQHRLLQVRPRRAAAASCTTNGHQSSLAKWIGKTPREVVTQLRQQGRASTSPARPIMWRA